MVELMLCDTCVRVVDMNFLGLAERRAVIQDCIVFTTDQPSNAGHAETAFVGYPVLARKFQLRIDADDGFVHFVVRESHYEDTLHETDLRPRQSCATFARHSVEH